MNKTTEYLSLVQTIINRPAYYNVSPHELKTLKSIKELLTKNYKDNRGRSAPSGKMKTKLIEINRVKSEPTTNIILYIMQLEKGEVYFRDLKNIINKLEGKDTRLLVGSSLSSLVRTEMVKRVKYGIYKLTDKGKRYIV